MTSLKKFWINLLSFLEQSLRFLLHFSIGFYRSLGSTHLGGACRFEPSCSLYALQAIQIMPIHKAIFLILKRIFSCRPGGPYGIDPVPVFKGKNNESK
jgi:putative membrane protein insertion efficiency factor